MGKVVLLSGGPWHGESLNVINEFEYKLRFLQDPAEINAQVAAAQADYTLVQKHGDYIYLADCHDTDKAKEVFTWTGWVNV